MYARIASIVRRLHRRRLSKGSVLAVAMLMLIVVTVAGSALLSMSALTRLNMVSRGMDVRLMIAAEAALESARGRFTLVAGAQEDWSALMPSSGWNNLGTVVVNGIACQLQAAPVGGPEVLRARVRAIATVGTRNKVVEYTIMAANFADYALYFGGNSTVSIGEYFKMVGNFYSRGSINLHNAPGIEFFGRTETSAKVMNWTSMAYNFKQGYDDNVPIVEIPPSAYGFGPMRTAAQASGTLFFANTVSIQLVGNKFIRKYLYRFTGTGSNYKKNDYQLRTQTLVIPDNSVIYVDSSTPPQGVDSYSAAANGMNRASEKYIELWGVLDEARVTIACEHEIHIVDNISYQTLLEKPSLRRYTEKQAPAALAFREMLGVVTQTDLLFETPSWTALPGASLVTNDASRNPPDLGHYTKQYSLDGVYMGVEKSARGAVGPGSGRELWVCGGIINGNHESTLLASNFDRRNYDTDYRLQRTTPPYFLRAYGVTATQITGTWRAYEQ